MLAENLKLISEIKLISHARKSKTNLESGSCPISRFQFPFSGEKKKKKRPLDGQKERERLHASSFRCIRVRIPGERIATRSDSHVFGTVKAGNVSDSTPRETLIEFEEGVPFCLEDFSKYAS